jgi:hypothetical protein
MHGSILMADTQSNHENDRDGCEEHLKRSSHPYRSNESISEGFIENIELVIEVHLLSSFLFFF